MSGPTPPYGNQIPGQAPRGFAPPMFGAPAPQANGGAPQQFGGPPGPHGQPVMTGVYPLYYPVLRTTKQRRHVLFPRLNT